MATQHPDNAGAPYWSTTGHPFVSAEQELSECVSAWQTLGVEEFMWDFEGKHADEAVIDKLFSEHYEFCKKTGIGRNLFLTFRVPNVWHEKGYSLLRSLMVILTSEDFARDLSFKNRPLFEVILPMTETAEQLIYIQTCYQKLARFKMATFNHNTPQNSEQLELIPLVESVSGQIGIAQLLKKYIVLHQKKFNSRLAYLRPFLARSDPAMVSGLLPTVLANKIALSELVRFSAAEKIPTFPIIGVGSLPFRGGLAPTDIPAFLMQYAGVRTVTVQSAFRYDHPLPLVKKSIALLKQKLPHTKAVLIPPTHQRRLMEIITESEIIYQKELLPVLNDLGPWFGAMPRRRERRQHLGFLSYGRKTGKTALPRAISFTGALYSLGIPPEFIGLSASLEKLSAADWKLINRYYPILKNDLARAGRFLNLENIRRLSKANPAWEKIAVGIPKIEKLLNLHFGPQTRAEHEHYDLSLDIWLSRHNSAALSRLITASGLARQSLG